MEITAEDLSMARIRMGIERPELAKILGVSLRTVANWENNGVPPHRVVLVMSKIGEYVTAAQEQGTAGLRNSAASKNRHDAAMSAGASIRDASLELSVAEFSEYLQREIEELNELAKRVTESATPDGKYLSRQEALLTYSTIELLDEVMRRVRGTEGDPDYSNMSERDAKDYGLAAFKGEENIEHDDLPHEP